MSTFFHTTHAGPYGCCSQQPFMYFVLLYVLSISYNHIFMIFSSIQTISSCYNSLGKYIMIHINQILEEPI